MTDNATLAALKDRYGEDLVFRVKKLVERAEANHVKITTAESLTAGGIAHLIACLDTNNTVLTRGNAVYTNTAKTDLLGVKKETLDMYDAVSAPVAEQMAEGALERAKEKKAISVSVTGFAGPCGNDDIEIDGSTVFIGTSCVKPNGIQKTTSEEFHFGKARTLDIRQTIIGAVTALEQALDESITGIQPAMTINDAMLEGLEHDPWMQRVRNNEFGKEYGKEISGNPHDPLLVEEYGEEVTARIQKILKAAVNQNCKIVVRGDAMASEIAHMLTTTNGSSRVVDRSIIEPGKSKTTLEEENPPGKALVVSAYTCGKGKVRISLEHPAPQRDAYMKEIPVGGNPTREVAEHALLALERSLQPQPEIAM